MKVLRKDAGKQLKTLLEESKAENDALKRLIEALNETRHSKVATYENLNQQSTKANKNTKAKP